MGSDVPDKRPSVLHVVPRLYDGGPSKVVYNLARAQAAECEVRLLAFHGGPGEALARDAGLPYEVLYPEERLGYPPPPIGPVRALRAARAIRSVAPDCAHIHLVGGWVEATVGARLARVPTVGHLHTVFRPDGATGINRNVLRCLRLFYRHGNLICLTDAAKAVFAHHGLRAHVVSNALDLGDFDQQSRLLPRALPDNGKLKVVLVARLEPEKCPLVFVRAAQDVLSRGPGGVEFYIVGPEGSLTGEVRRTVSELGLERNVHLTGYRDDVPAILRDCDMVCLTSMEEGFPVALVEAGAAGKACVVTETTGMREIIEDGVTGFVVPVGDHQAVAEGVLRLARNRALRAQLGQAARHRVERRFTSSAQAERTKEVYREVFRDRRCFAEHADG